MTIKQIKESDRNKYNDLKVNVEKAIKSIYPEVNLKYSEPGCWGHSAEITCFKKEDEWILQLPDGEYKSNKHYHNAGHSILNIESAQNRYNNRPLFLLCGRAYNGDYHSLKKTYYLFGQNEDGSFFLHKIRPKVGETADFDEIRKWIWQLKDNETVQERQGDIVFIRKEKPARNAKLFINDVSKIVIDSHEIYFENCFKTSKKTFVYNPHSYHREHGETKNLNGWFEVRQARAWMASID